MSHRGSLLCLPNGIWAWPVTRAAEIDRGVAGSGSSPHADGIDPLSSGPGTELAAAIRPAPALRDREGRARSMPTGPAIRTYNILLGERRRVARGPDRGGVSGRRATGSACLLREPGARGTMHRFLATLFAPADQRRRCLRSTPSISRSRAVPAGEPAAGRRNPAAMVARLLAGAGHGGVRTIRSPPN